MRISKIEDFSWFWSIETNPWRFVDVIHQEFRDIVIAIAEAFQLLDPFVFLGRYCLKMPLDHAAESVDVAETNYIAKRTRRTLSTDKAPKIIFIFRKGFILC